MSRESKGSILIVDDEHRIRELLREMLNLVGFEVFEAENGIEAFEQIRRQRPDVIILDIMLPNMDGISVCKQIRDDATTADLPIIMLTGKTHLNADKEGLEAGANKYLFKPVSMDSLINSIREVLSDK